MPARSGREPGRPEESLTQIGNPIGNIVGSILGNFTESGASSGASPGCLKRTIPGHGHGIATPSTSIERVETAHKPLTIKEAAAEMRICLSHAYELAHEYLNRGGTSGLPVLRFGTCMRVPRWALDVLITTGRVVRLADATVPTDGLHRASRQKLEPTSARQGG